MPREDLKVERRDFANARLEALRERKAAYDAAGEKIPDHLAHLLKEAEKAGGKKEARHAEAPVAPKKAATRKTPDGTGYFYEDGHGVEPKHADSTDADGYHVPRPADAPGAAPLADHPQDDFSAVEPVEKYPDFANPAKKGDAVPEEARRRGLVEDAQDVKAKGSVGSDEKIAKEREKEAEKAAVGKPVDPAKAVNPLPDPSPGSAPARAEKKPEVKGPAPKK